MTALLDGPQCSVYEQGQFKLDILFPNDYPFKPPVGIYFIFILLIKSNSKHQFFTLMLMEKIYV